MTGPLDQVIRQLKAAIEKLDTAAITALRAQADAQQAHTHYDEAGRGSTHPAIQGAKTESTTAAEKAGKVGRLLAETSTHLTTYVNIIAPGTIPPGHSTETALPTGEELVADTVKRTASKQDMDAYLGMLVRKVDDVKDHAEKAVNIVGEGIKFVRAPHGPSGSQSTGSTTPTTPAPQPQPKIDASEAAGHLVVIALVAGVAVRKSAQLIGKGIARLRAGERTQRTE